MQVGMWNTGCLSRKGEVCIYLRKSMTDVCCVQEVIRRGQVLRMSGMEGLLEYTGDFSCSNLEIELVVSELKKLCEKVVEVRKVNDGVMAVVLVFR